MAVALFVGAGFARAVEASVGPMPSGSSAAGPLTLTDVKALTERLASDEPAVHDQALRTIVDSGDASLLALLDEALAEADRATRVAVKPAKDLLKNKLNLASETDEVRRSAAADLGTSGQLSAVAWLQLAASKETKPWVRYAMEESAALLQLTRGDSTLKARAATTLGEMRSQNGLPALKEFVQEVSSDPALGEANQQALLAANRAIEQIEIWST
ncbi:MAG: hypothetical protein KGJ48_11530, partial [Nitrospirota bacterium]|nr:hypothetical protein [Nitrospirota bacterium]